MGTCQSQWLKSLGPYSQWTNHRQGLQFITNFQGLPHRIQIERHAGYSRDARRRRGARQFSMRNSAKLRWSCRPVMTVEMSSLQILTSRLGLKERASNDGPRACANVNVGPQRSMSHCQWDTSWYQHSPYCFLLLGFKWGQRSKEIDPGPSPVKNLENFMGKPCIIP